MGYHPTESAHTACYMIPDLGVVFDIGTGFHRVPKNVKTDSLDIFLSHAHTDHVAGIPSINELTQITQCKKVRVYGEKETLEAVELLTKPPFFPIQINIEYVPLKDGEKIQLENGAVVTHFSQKHSGSCVGYRLERGDVSFAYVTDTTSDGESMYIKDVSGVKVLAHEMYCGKKEAEIAPKLGHTSLTGLKAFVEKTKPGKVIAIHHNPAADLEKMEKEAKEDIENLIFSYDNLEIDI